MNIKETTDKIMSATASDAGNSREVIESILAAACTLQPNESQQQIADELEAELNQYDRADGNYDYTKRREAILAALTRATEAASDAYGRGVTAGKLEAMQYTPEERERYGKWAAINWPASRAAPASADPLAPIPVTNYKPCLPLKDLIEPMSPPASAEQQDWHPCDHCKQFNKSVQILNRESYSVGEAKDWESAMSICEAHNAAAQPQNPGWIVEKATKATEAERADHEETKRDLAIMEKIHYPCNARIADLEHQLSCTAPASAEQQDRLEKMLIHCHMALISIWPASDAWSEVGKWLCDNGNSEYAKALRQPQKERTGKK